LTGVPEDQLVNDEPAERDGSDAGDAAWDAWSHPTAARRRRPRTDAQARRPKLSRRARSLITTLVAAGIVGAAVAVLLQIGGGRPVDREAAARHLDEAQSALAGQQRSCSGTDVACLHQAAGALSLAYRDFDVTVDRVAVPGDAADAQNTVEDDAELLSNAYDELSVAPTASAYQRIYSRDDVATLLAAFDRHYTALVAAVHAG
jgi:hypothetical protein